MSLAGRHLQAEQVVSLDGAKYRFQAFLTDGGKPFAGPIASCPTWQPLEAWPIVDRDRKGAA